MPLRSPCHSRRRGWLTVFACASLLITPLSAQEWVVVDTFADGEPQGTWTFNSGFTTQFRPTGIDGVYSLWYTSVGVGTSTGNVLLPESVSSGKVTIAFDFFAPGGRSLNQVGFGAGSAAMVARGAWAGVGLANRFQMVDRTSGATDFRDKIPQVLVKAGEASADVEWTVDLLDPTVQGVWYNLWIVYDLEPGEFSLYARRADAPSEEPIHRGTWQFRGANIAEDFAQISHLRAR
jgi:hypothetical protein